MIRYRILQRLAQGDNWAPDAYVIEKPNGQFDFRYPLSWEYLGGRWNRRFRRERPALEQLDRAIDLGERLRWLPVEATDEELDVVTARLDTLCHIRRSQPPETIEVQGKVEFGRLMLSLPHQMLSDVRVQDNRIWLGSRWQVVVTLESSGQAQPSN